MPLSSFHVPKAVNEVLRDASQPLGEAASNLSFQPLIEAGRETTPETIARPRSSEGDSLAIKSWSGSIAHRKWRVKMSFQVLLTFFVGKC